MLRGWQHFSGKVLIITSGNDLTAQEFVEYAAGSPNWDTTGRLSTFSLEQADHTCSTPSSRQAAERKTLEWLSKN